MEESRVLRTCLEDGTVRWRLYNLWVTRPIYLASVYCSVSFALESIKELLFYTPLNTIDSSQLSAFDQACTGKDDSHLSGLILPSIGRCSSRKSKFLLLLDCA